MKSIGKESFLKEKGKIYIILFLTDFRLEPQKLINLDILKIVDYTLENRF